jgi:hypothetical protein
MTLLCIARTRARGTRSELRGWACVVGVEDRRSANCSANA